DESRVGAVGQMLGLADHTAVVLPGAGLVLEGVEATLGLTRVLEPCLGSHHPRPEPLQQDVVFRQSNDVADLAQLLVKLVELGEKLWGRKGAVGSHQDHGARAAESHRAHQSLDHPHGTPCAADIARTKYNAGQVAGLSVED